MDIPKRSICRIWPLFFAAVIALCALAVPGTLAILTDHTAPLVNTFRPDGIVHAEGVVEVHVLKTVRNLGDKAMLPQGFQFTLTDVATGETATATTAANGRAVFRLFFDADDAGTHRYRLTEVQGMQPGVTYSELEYAVRVDVTLAEELQTTVYLDGEKTALAQARFENLYDSSADPDTGDATPLMWYGAALIAGMAGIALLIRKARRYVA